MAKKKVVTRSGAKDATAPKKPQAKKAATSISHQQAFLIWNLIKDIADLDDPQGASSAPLQDASELHGVYDQLLGHGFREDDVRGAMTALRPINVDSALDWLCLHVPPDALPPRFSAGARVMGADVDVQARVAQLPAQGERPAQPSSEERAASRAAMLDDMRRAAAAEEARAQAEAQEAAAANKARILAQYQAQSDGESGSASEGGEEEERIEDWELWGDPKEIERRRAERTRATQLRTLSERDRNLLLARELAQAKGEAQVAKAVGHAARKRAAGDVIKHLKLEIAAAGVTEAELERLLAQHDPPSSAPVRDAAASGPTGRAKNEVHDQHTTTAASANQGNGTSVADASDARPAGGNWDDESDAEADVGVDTSALVDTAEVESHETPESGVNDGGCPAEALRGSHDCTETPGAVDSSGGDRQRRVEGPGEPAGDAGAASDDDFGLDLFEDAAVFAESLEAAPMASGPQPGGAGAQVAPTAPVRKRTLAKPAAPALPVGVPKAIFQQFCHRQTPPWGAPRFNKISRAGESFRYSCTVATPPPRFGKKVGPDGKPWPASRTWQLLESEDGYSSIQEAQNAAVVKALLELMPELPQQYTLEPPYRELWQRWTEQAGEPGGARGDADDSRAAFIDALVQARLQARAAEAPPPASNGAAPRQTPDGAHPEAATADACADQHPRDRGSPVAETSGRADDAAGREGERMRRELEDFRGSAAGREWAEKRARLPVLQVRDTLLEALRVGDVAVLSGDTGCGKTTQVPQYLLEHEIEQGRGAQCHVICTQPRRLAAISVAERVAAERGEPPPGRPRSRIGYQVRLDNAVTADTRLTFCTTGIVLRRLASDAALAGVTHVVVDEVHERSLQGDFLVALLKGLVAARRQGGGPPLKVVLMSATIDLDLLCDYFGGCPAMTAAGRTFPVDQVFLEDVYAATEYRLAEDSPAALRPRRDDGFRKHSEKQAGDKKKLLREGWGDDDGDAVLNRHYDEDAYAEYPLFVRKNLRRVDEGAIDYDLMEDLVLHIDRSEGEGAILVFLPGMREIAQLVDRLGARHELSQGRHWVVPLHSSVAAEEQRRAFVVPPAGVRKIVVGTNIAETSITIEDVVFVVDSGKLKERRYNATRGMSMLVLAQISQASSQQRKGRAGRVRPGKCYALFTRACHEGRMSRYQVPEVMRVPLGELVLQIHLLRLGRAAPFLAAMLQPPAERAVAAAVRSLQVIGALSADEALTPLGAHLAQLPLEPHLGKLLVLACFVGCLSGALTVAACLSGESPFVTSFAASDQAEAAQRALAAPGSGTIAAGQQSDHLVMAAAYAGWQAALDRGGAQAGRAFARRHSLSPSALLTLRDMRRQFATMLADIGLISASRSAHWADDRAAPWNAHAADAAVLKAALCAAAYPQVACMDGDVRGHARPSWHDAAGAVALHPASTLHALLAGQFASPYVVYTEKVATSRAFLRQASVVAPVALLLFGGAMEVHHDAGYVLLDGWLKISVAAQTAVLVKKLRQAWAAVLDAKVKRPRDPLGPGQARVVDTLVGLLREDAIMAC